MPSSSCGTIAAFSSPRPGQKSLRPDAERRHSFDEAKAQYSSLLRTYEGLGYNLVELPKIDVESRVEFIVGQLAASGS
jgi:predicted ATPase